VSVFARKAPRGVKLFFGELFGMPERLPASATLAEKETSMKTFTRISAVLGLAAMLGSVVPAFAASPMAPTKTPMTAKPGAKSTVVHGYTRKGKNGKMVTVKPYARGAKKPKTTHVKGYTRTTKTGKTVAVKGYNRMAPAKKK